MDLKKRTILGRTGVEVSRLGLAGGYGISGKALEKAYHDFGINYFYWSTPRRSGMRDGLRHLIKNHREDIFIVLQTYDHLGLTVNRAVHKGLKALEIDYADMILLGWFNKFPRKKIIDQSLVLKEDGLIRFIGMSGHNRKTFGKIAQQNDSPIDVFMVRYNAAHTGAEVDIFPHLPANNRPGITIYTATCWRKLLNQKKMPPGEQALTADECYRFVLSNRNVDLCMMGPSNEQQMLEGLTALEKGILDDEEIARVRRIGDCVHG